MVRADFTKDGARKIGAKAHAWEWVVGSFVLAIIVSLFGMLVTYSIARLVRRK